MGFWSKFWAWYDSPGRATYKRLYEFWYQQYLKEQDRLWHTTDAFKITARKLGHAERILKSAKDELRDTAKGNSVRVRITKYFDS